MKLSAMASSTRLTAAAAAVLLLLVSGAAAQTCPPQYGSIDLLFGGDVYSSCKANCQSRQSNVARRCSMKPGSAWDVCTGGQAKENKALAATLGGGAALRLAPCNLMAYLRGRTLWILGDSHAKQLYRALQCFLLDFWDHKECEAGTDASAVQQLYNLPRAPGQSQCFNLLGAAGGRVCIVHAVLGTSLLGNPSLPAGGVLPLLRQKFASKQDIFLIGFGSWHKKTAADMNTFKPALEALGKYYQQTRAQWPHLLFRETPATHDVDPNNKAACVPTRGYSYSPSTGGLNIDPASRLPGLAAWRLGVTTNAAANEVLPKYGVTVLPAFSISVPLASNHIPNDACIHFCHPGVPEMGVWTLYDAMRSGKSGIAPVPAGTRANYPCVNSYSARFTDE